MGEERKRRAVKSGTKGIACPICGDLFTQRSHYRYHLDLEHSPQAETQSTFNFALVQNVFRGAKIVYRLSPSPGAITDVLQLFKEDHDNAETVLRYELARKKSDFFHY